MHALVETETQITVGVDTHADIHVAAAVDQLGRLLGTHSVPVPLQVTPPCLRRPARLAHCSASASKVQAACDEKSRSSSGP
jgi:hypothetical protein